ncbi:MAG: hypothetical protein PSN37_05455 [Alphaproteobacteria bacterium]|nr:hypothetical protein [Alphaproteobacteria bacterium]
MTLLCILMWLVLRLCAYAHGVVSCRVMGLGDRLLSKRGHVSLFCLWRGFDEQARSRQV